MAGNTDGEVVIKVDLSSDDAEKELSRLKRKLLSLEEDLTVGQSKKSALEKRLENINSQIGELNQKKIRLGGPGLTNSEAEAMNQLAKESDAVVAAIERQEQAIQNTKDAIDGVKMRYAEVSAIAKRASFGGSLSAIGEKLRNIAGGIAGSLKSCVKQLNRMFGKSKSLSKSFGGIGTAVKRIAPALLATEGVIGILRKAVNAYMQQNQRLANTLNGVWTGLGNIMGPVIDRMVNLLATAIAYFTKFLNLLGFTGKAASKQISGAGDAAKKETDALEKQLMSFDELNVLQDNKSDSSGGGSSGADAGITPNVQLPDWAQLMAQQLRSAQWAEAASTLTTTLNNMVDSVNWRGIGAKIGSWLNGAMTFLTTAINTFDWQGLGGSLSTAANNLIANVNWDNLGTLLWAKFKIILETLAGFLLNLDMPEFAQAASRVVISFFDSITQTLQTIDWQAIGSQIGVFLKNVDWGGIATAIWNAFWAAVGAVLSTIWGLVLEIFDPYIEQMKEAGLSDGEAIAGGIITGLFDGIIRAMAGIGAWIKEHVFDPFMKWFKEAFGIHSPSTVMAEQGGYIIEGMLNGITGAWQRVKDWFSKALSDIKNAFSEAWTSVRNTTANIWNGIVNAIRGAVNKVISVINRMIRAVVDGINAVFRRLSFNVSLPGGKRIGLSLPQVSAPQIPYLAQGAVIPPNAPFAAVLGDQKHGTNIEAPLETIQEAVAQVMDDQLAAMLAGFEAVVQAIQEKDMSVVIGDKDIGEANARYSRRVAIRRG